MNTLSNKKILLGVTGGIAAYKSADLIRRLKEQGADVQVVMTQSAKEFITAMTLQALSGKPVRDDLWDPSAEAAMGHIELARWADVILIAPASADFMARLTHGFANDLLATLCLATTAPIILAPAMNQQMWQSEATQTNVKILIERGVQLIGPAEGSQACGEVGPGRMIEPLEIAAELNNFFLPKQLSGKRVLITAGPTQENIDPVRYLGNRSSGKMGFALAAAAIAAGAEVTLIAGPVTLPTPAQVQRIDVKTAEQMQKAVMDAVNHCDIFIAAAAVADYRCANIASQKIKKGEENLHLELVRNPDILMSVSQLKKPPFTVGFAAETENVFVNAKAKLSNKKLNMIIANLVGEGKAFSQDDNEVVVLWDGDEKAFPKMPKKQLAVQLIKLIAEHL